MKKILIFAVTLLLLVPNFSALAVSTSAKAAVVINAENGEIIYSENCDEKLPMASTTKIMTALLLCEYGNPDREIKITEEMVRVEGSSMGLLPNDTVTLDGLLYGMMLSSGNDAANATAFILGGSVSGFLELMNRKACKLGLLNTHFSTPSGLDAEDHYTTAYELALLSAKALENPRFKAAASSETATIYYGNPPYRRTLTNHNKLLKSYDGLIGVKTGFTKKSGRCLVTAAERDSKRLVSVTLNDPNDWQDHKNLLDYGFSKLKTVTVKPPQSSLTFPVVGGVSDNIIVKLPKISINTVDEKQIVTELITDNFLYAPIKKGEKIGEYRIFSEGVLIKTVNILSENEVEKTEITFVECLFENFVYMLSEFI